MNQEKRTRQDYEHVLQQLRKVRDEITLHAHLGSMELKSQWEKLEPKIFEAEKYVEEVTDATWSAGHELVRRARKLRDELKELRENQRTVGHR